MADHQIKISATMTDQRVMVFAVFHLECLIDTMDECECDDIPYVWNARQLVDDMLNSIGRGSVKNINLPKTHLSLLQGGLVAS